MEPSRADPIQLSRSQLIRVTALEHVHIDLISQAERILSHKEQLTAVRIDISRLKADAVTNAKKLLTSILRRSAIIADSQKVLFRDRS